MSVLRQRNFVLVWSAGLISLTGDWMLWIAVPVHVYAVTGSTIATGVAFAARVIPQLALGSVAGVFVDRWDRKRIMVAANLARAAIIVPLLFVGSPDTLWIVYAAIAIETSIGLLFGPAENALLPRLVGEKRLLEANSLNSLNNNLARLVGPALGGLVVGFTGLSAPRRRSRQ